MREVLRTKKQKLEDDDSQMNVAHSRRVVEILRGDAADSEGEDSTPSGRMVYETTVVTSERIHVVLENRRKLNSPYSESRVSTPDRSRTPDEPRRKLPSPEYKKRRRLPSPESERRARSPGRKRHEHPTEYSISRAGSSAGSWAISDMKHSTRKRSRIENESPSFSKDYSTEMPTGSRRERQRTISPSESHYSSVSERDSFQASARISRREKADPDQSMVLENTMCEAAVAIAAVKEVDAETAIIIGQGILNHGYGFKKKK